MHVNTVHTAALAKMTKPAVVHPGKILPGKLLFSLSIYITTRCHLITHYVYSKQTTGLNYIQPPDAILSHIMSTAHKPQAPTIYNHQMPSYRTLCLQQTNHRLQLYITTRCHLIAHYVYSKQTTGSNYV